MELSALLDDNNDAETNTPISVESVSLEFLRSLVFLYSSVSSYPSGVPAARVGELRVLTGYGIQ